jgi:hypothetical protein
LVEGGADPVVHWHINSEFVVSAAKVLHERVPGRNRPCRGEAFQSAHRPKSGLQPAVIGFHQVVPGSVERCMAPAAAATLVLVLLAALNTGGR